MTITRSTGIPAGYGLFAGGGYSGASESLDQTVQYAAEAMQQAFGRDVEIRFNSDRCSGGAWMRHPGEGVLGANVKVGVRAVLITQEANERAVKHLLALASMQRKPGLYVSARFAHDVARGGLKLDKPSGIDTSGQPYTSAEHESVDAAIAWLTERIDVAKLPI